MAEWSREKTYTLEEKLDRVIELTEAYDNLMEVTTYDKDLMDALNLISEELEDKSADKFFEDNFCSFEKLNEACDEFGYSRVERQK